MTSFIDVLYIIAFGMFIYGLMGLTGPRTAVRGNMIAAVGMIIAIIATLLTPWVRSAWRYCFAGRRGASGRRLL